MILTSNSPSAGYIAWQDVVIVHKNISYTITNGNSDKVYVWWDYSTPTVLQESDTQPTLEDNDAILFINSSGTYTIVWSNLINGLAISTGTIPTTALVLTDEAEKFMDASGNFNIPVIEGQFIFTVPGELTTGTNKTLELYASTALTITEVFISVKTAPTGSDNLIIDVDIGGTTIFTDQDKRPQITTGTNTDTSDTPDVTALVKGNKITINIDQIGNTLPGEDLTVMLRFTQP